MASTLNGRSRPIVVVTGMGVATSLGAGKAENWRKLSAGESGIRTIRRFDTEGLKTRVAGTIDFVTVEPFCAPALCERLGEIVIEEAVAESGIGSSGDFPGPLFLAVAPIEIEWQQRQEVAAACGANGDITYDDLIRAAEGGRFRDYFERVAFASVADHLAGRFGTKGSPISLSTACASGATAIQLGVEAIRRGETDAALCVATDSSVNQESLIRFSLLSALSTHNDPPRAAAKPFARNRDGFVMAEGAGALVLESLAAATARGARILGVIEGCGETADSFHRTRSSPDGKPIIGSIRNAIADAQLQPDDIDYINLHGTGTKANEAAEDQAVFNIFGGNTPCSSTKGATGHLLGAAGVCGAIISALCIQHDFMPGGLNTEHIDPALKSAYLLKNKQQKVNFVLSNSLGFGGSNCSLVLGKVLNTVSR